VGLQEVRVSKAQVLLLQVLFYLLAMTGVTWQFGPIGLYTGGGLGILLAGFIDIEKGGDDG
jgi:hypothetical protein